MLKYFYSGIIAIALLSIGFILGVNYGRNEKAVEYQEKEIKTNNVNNVIIEESVKKRKANSVMPIDDVWSKLFSKYCSDC